MDHEILAADIGNTNITLCRMRGLKALKTIDVSSNTPARGIARRLFRAHRGLPLVVASVNPRAMGALLAAWRAAGGAPALVLGRDFKVPIPNRTAKPRQVGQDRLVNALAATRYCKGNAIVVDFGTAITFDVVRGGAYAGGVITPGIGLAMDALYQKTALLPLVSPHGRPPVVGRDTHSAINAGVFYGYIGLVANILRELRKTFKRPACVLATGGYGAYLQPHIGAIDRVLPHLTHEGIAMCYTAWLAA